MQPTPSIVRHVDHGVIYNRHFAPSLWVIDVVGVVNAEETPLEDDENCKNGAKCLECSPKQQ